MRALYGFSQSQIVSDCLNRDDIYDLMPAAYMPLIFSGVSSTPDKITEPQPLSIEGNHFFNLENYMF
jgi:hypothetical protein